MRAALLLVIALLCLAPPLFAGPVDWVFPVCSQAADGPCTDLGTGFLLRESNNTNWRAFLTCDHVLTEVLKHGTPSIRSHTIGVTWKVFYYTTDSHQDLAVLYVHPGSLPSLAQDGFLVGHCDTYAARTRTTAWGYPREWDGVKALEYSGPIAHPSPYQNRHTGNVIPRVVVNIDLHHGFSGGPLVPTAKPDHVIGVSVTKHKDSRVIHNSKTARALAPLKNCSNCRHVRIGSIEILPALQDIVSLQEATSHLGSGEAVALSPQIVADLLSREPTAVAIPGIHAAPAWKPKPLFRSICTGSQCELTTVESS